MIKDHGLRLDDRVEVVRAEGFTQAPAYLGQVGYIVSLELWSIHVELDGGKFIEIWAGNLRKI